MLRHGSLSLTGERLERDADQGGDCLRAPVMTRSIRHQVF